VRSLFAWSFALLMLLSSGSLQLVLHSCPGTGVFVFSDCGMHDQVEKSDIPECCRKKLSAKTKQQNCGNCEEYFVFSITPKFGSITIANTGEPPVIFIEKNLYSGDLKLDLKSNVLWQSRKELSPKLLNINTLNCSWLI